MTALDLLAAPGRHVATLEHTDHRPWPLPEGRWVQGQTWDDLLFAHWRVPFDALRNLVPAALSLDEWEGDAWLGMTPFACQFRLRGTWPVPRLTTFLEINVRTYVTYAGKPGIFFFSLDADNPVVVRAARALYKLPYFWARMSAHRYLDGLDFASARRESSARPFVWEGRYTPSGRVFNADPDSLEYFLTERYCLYTLDRGRVHRAEIHHPPWPLQTAEAKIELNSMAPRGVRLPDDEPLLHFAQRQDVIVWPLTEADTTD